MRVLAFEHASRCIDGRRVRAARFEERSRLPTSATCVVAGGVRETLAALLARPVNVRVLEPAIPSPQAWPAILRGARLYRVRGSAADAAIVLRPLDAAALAAAAFGELDAGGRCELSAIERELLDRLASTVAAAFGAVCGAAESHPAEPVGAIAGFVTYFELLLDVPVVARIGVALSREPSPEPHGRLTLEDLAAVGLVARLSLEVGAIEAAAIAGLEPGAFVPITRSSPFRGRLAIGDRVLATGACGVRNDRYAIAIP